MDLTKEILVKAGIDISNVCQLDPAFNTNEEEFSNESEFIENLKTEITQFVEYFEEKENTKVYDFQAGDIVLLKEETKEVIKELSPNTVQRLKEVFGVFEKKEEKKEEKKKEKPQKEIKTHKIGSTTKVMMLICDNPNITKEEIKTILSNEGLKISEATLDIQSNDTRKTLKYLHEIGKIS